jgi:multiple sugar transport system permease protein
MVEGRAFRWVRRVGLTVLTAFVSFPLYVMVSASVQPLADVEKPFRWIPRHLTLSAYSDVWTTLPLARFLSNSAIVSGCTTAIALAVGVPAAYAFARFGFPGGGFLNFGLLATQFAPGMLFLLPLFLLYAQLNRDTGLELIGTYPGLVLTDLTFTLPFSIWMLTGYFAELPRDVEDAATVQGATPVTVLRRVVIPSSIPVLIAVGTFSFAISWGEVQFASILSDDATRTVSVGLPAFVDGSVPYWNQAMAAGVYAAIPVLAVFALSRRFLIRGIRGSISS